MAADIAQVRVHESQFPGRVREQRLESLRRRMVHPKFHYDSVQQAQKWLELHERYSPASRELSDIYAAAFGRVRDRLGEDQPACLVGLGCGGGQKETCLLEALGERVPAYRPVDSSLPLVLEAWQRAQKIVSARRLHPFVCDLTAASDWQPLFDETDVRWSRLVTLFGVLPNLEPGPVLGSLVAVLRENDLLLLSVNLAPGTDYREGVESVLPQYDNDLTRQWLSLFLSDIGLSPADGDIQFEVESAGGMEFDLIRVVALFSFHRERKITVDGETFQFGQGDRLRLFFSYRHTGTLVPLLMKRYGFEVLDRWISEGGEEGVFLCQRTGKDSTSGSEGQ